MNFLTFTYLVSGKCHSTLINRMHREKISLLKMRIIDEKRAKITIYAKDRVKYFAICENLCYNKLIGIGGVFAPVYRLLKVPELVVGAFVFLAVLAVGSNLYFGKELIGDAPIYAARIEEVFKDVGIKPFSLLDRERLNKAECALKNSDVSFVKVEKSGNRAIIGMYSSFLPPEKIMVSKTDVLAKEDCTILKIIAYSGTSLVTVGEKVRKGQPLIGAYEFLNDGSKTDCVITGYVLIEGVFEFCYSCEFEPDESTKTNALAAAKFMLGDKSITRYDLAQNDKDITVTLYYESLLFGNELFGG